MRVNQKAKAKTDFEFVPHRNNRVTCLTSHHHIGSEQASDAFIQNNASSHNVFTTFPQEENDEKYYSIQALRRKHLFQNLIKKIKHLIPPRNQPSDLMQNWEEDERILSSKGAKSEMEPQQISNLNNIQTQIGFKNSWWKFFQIFEGISLIALFWMASIELFFLPKAYQQEQLQTLFPFALKCSLAGVLILKVLIKQIFVLSIICEQNSIEEQDEANGNPNPDASQQQYKINVNEDIKKPLMNLFIYSVFLIVDSLLDPESEVRYIMLTLLCFALFARMTKLHLSFEPIITYIQAKNLKNEFRLLRLLLSSIALCHLIALIMYSMIYIYTDLNWLTSIQHESSVDKQVALWIRHYVYAMYWAITTIVTVGYGDITPTRFLQIIVISFVQLIGTAMFGYMINVIGITVAEINKKNEAFDNQISTINKLAEQYQISRRLCQKFKNQIIHNEEISKQIPLNSAEETELLKLISPKVKQSFTLQTNIKVIKKSIYFLTYFTVNFQNQIALKLIRCIYRKDEVIKIVQEKKSESEQYKLISSQQSEKFIESPIKNTGLFGEQDNTKYRRITAEDKERYLAIINSGTAKMEFRKKKNNIQISKFLKAIKIEDGKPTLNVFGYSSAIMNKDIDLEATAQQNSVVYLLKRKDIVECLDKNMLDFESFSEQKQKMLQYRNLNEIEAPSLMDITQHYIPNVYLIMKKNRKFYQPRSKEFSRNRKRTKLKLITFANYKDKTSMYIEDDKEEIEDAYFAKNFSSTLINANEAYQPDQQLKKYKKINTSVLEKMDVMKTFENFMKRFNIDNVITKYHQFLTKNRLAREKESQIAKYAQLRKQLDFSERDMAQEAEIQSQESERSSVI